MGQETLAIWELAVRVKTWRALSTGAGSEEEEEGYVPPLASGGRRLCWKPPGLLCVYLINTRASNHYSCHQP